MENLMYVETIVLIVLLFKHVRKEYERIFEFLKVSDLTIIEIVLFVAYLLQFILI